jgi:pyruvate/2-oxoglutarate dehydrogenase complex dihydrolipoamide acyltransferase (E2) component
MASSMAFLSSLAGGDGAGEIRLVRWLVRNGEIVTLDQPIAEIETEKASMDVAGWAAGILRQIANQGDRLTAETVVDGFARIDPVVR